MDKLLIHSHIRHKLRLFGKLYRLTDVLFYAAIHCLCWTVLHNHSSHQLQRKLYNLHPPHTRERGKNTQHPLPGLYPGYMLIFHLYLHQCLNTLPTKQQVKKAKKNNHEKSVDTLGSFVLHFWVPFFSGMRFPVYQTSCLRHHLFFQDWSW